MGQDRERVGPKDTSPLASQLVLRDVDEHWYTVLNPITLYLFFLPLWRYGRCWLPRRCKLGSG